MTKYFVTACLLLATSRVIAADAYTLRNDAVYFFSTGGGVVVLIFLILVFILWFLLPFAVFGVKGKLNNIIDEAKKTNRLLNEIKEELTDNRTKEISVQIDEEKIASIEKFL